MAAAEQNSDFRRVALFVAAVALLVAFAFQGSRALWAPDEGIFGAVAKEMRESGSWLVPTLHRQPYPEKPPFIYWMMLAGMDLLGQNEWGLRLFFALTLPLTAWFVALIGFELWGRREGLLAALVYVTMILPVGGANVARPDAPLTLFVAAAFYCFVKSLKTEGGRCALWKMLMCAAFGLGFASKGPAVLVFAAPMFIYVLDNRSAVRYFLTPWALLGVAVFAVIGLSWYWAMIRTVPGVAAYFWDNQVWGRLVTTTYRRNPSFAEGVFKVYGPALLVGALPWALLWPYWLFKARPAIFTVAWWSRLQHRHNALLLAIWFELPVAVFLIAKSKLPLYVMPVFPALALITARLWTLHPPPLLSQTAGERLPRFALIAVWAAALIAAKGAAAHYFPQQDERKLAAEIESHSPPDCAEVLLVNEELNGIAFYMQPRVLDATVHIAEYPNFIPTPQLSRLVDEALESKTSFVVFSRKDKAQLSVVEAVFNQRGIEFVKTELGNKHVLLIPAAAPAPKALADKPAETR